jgi:hypothetical protein
MEACRFWPTIMAHSTTAAPELSMQLSIVCAVHQLEHIVIWHNHEPLIGSSWLGRLQTATQVRMLTTDLEDESRSKNCWPMPSLGKLIAQCLLLAGEADQPQLFTNQRASASSLTFWSWLAGGCEDLTQYVQVREQLRTDGEFH